MKVMPDGGNIVILEGELATSGQVGLTGGFLEAIKDMPQYKVLDKQTTDWMRDKAVTVMEDFLTKYQEIDFAYCHDDVIASGAFQAIEAAGREGILSCAVGASFEACDMIREGKLAFAIDQPPEYESRISVQLAIRICNGEKLDKIHYITVGLVDADNVDTFEPVF